MTAADQPTTEPSAEVHARAMVVSRVLREHEPRPMACSCGTRLGDSIDSRWHLANQVAAAVADALAPAPQPAADTETEVQWGVRLDDGTVLFAASEERARDYIQGGGPSIAWRGGDQTPSAVVRRTITKTSWEEA